MPHSNSDSFLFRSPDTVAKNNMSIDPALGLGYSHLSPHQPQPQPSQHQHSHQQVQQQHLQHQQSQQFLPGPSSRIPAFPDRAGKSASPSIPSDPRYPIFGDILDVSSSPMGSSKRPASGFDNSSAESSSHKKAKKESETSDNGDGDREDDDDESQDPVNAQRKVKATRGSRACTVCRRLKMKCVGAENGPPCKRCIAGRHQCIFEESNRGKRSSKKHEVLTKSLKKMELTLETVMRSLNNPNIASIVAAGGLAHPSSHENTDSSPNAVERAEHTDPSTSTDSPQSLTPSLQNVLTQKTETLNSRSVVTQSPPSPRRDPITLTGQKPSTEAALSPQLNSLPDNALNPLGLLAEASLATNRRDRDIQKEREDLIDSVVNGPAPGTDEAKPKGKVGVANEVYFRPGPINILPLRRLFIERQIQPEMLSFTTTEEVIDLFKIFFEHMNRHCPLLSSEFHTPSLVCSRSPFLLTVISAIASKFYGARPDLNSRLNQIAKKLAFSVPERGYKSLEIVQAYLLLVLWGCGPVERFEQDKTWLLLGLAIRMGTDLNLHRKGAALPADAPRAEWRARERELRNRERTWIACYTLDRSVSAQMGKPHSVLEDYTIRNCGSWYKSPETLPTDPGLMSYAELQRILSRSLDFLYSSTSSPSGLLTETDYLLVIKTIESQILAWHDQWSIMGVECEGLSPLGALYVNLMMRFYLNYSMLVINSFGLQNALERSPLDVSHFFGRCYSSAKTCATVIRDELGPRGFLRYAPDSHFVLTSYAVLTLLKLIRTEFQPYMENEERILTLVNEVVETLQSVAVSSSHTPALYSTFLRAVVSTRTGTSCRSSPRPATANGRGALPTLESNVNVPDPSSSPLDLASGPGAGVFGDEQQFGDGALGLKMFPPPQGSTNGTGAAGPSNDPSWRNGATTPLLGSRSGDTDLQNALSFQLPAQFINNDDFGSMSMDNILSGGFWDNVLIPGYSSGLEGLSGGFVYGTGGSGIITPRRYSPDPETPPGLNGVLNKPFLIPSGTPIS